MKVRRKIIEIDEEKCDGCGQCVIACAEGALQIIDGKAKLVSESYCDGLGACIGECPQGAIAVVERETEDFDPEAVEKHLETLRQKEMAQQQVNQSAEIHACPSVAMQQFQEGAVLNWPVKLKLVSPNAPFLKGPNLLVAADCAPVVLKNFQDRFASGRVVLIGCPKFDNPDEYFQKLKAIFSSMSDSGGRNLKVVVLRMEVPCCSGLTGLVQKAISASGRDISVEEIVTSTDGNLIAV